MATTGANGGGVSKLLPVYTGRAQTAAEPLLPATRLHLPQTFAEFRPNALTNCRKSLWL